MTVSKRLAEFDSNGTTVRGWLFEPEAATVDPVPAIVMLHGFTATSTGMVADLYAEAFASVGITALLFDPRGFGLSDGEPRQGVNEWKQARDIQAGIAYLEGSRQVDPSRIAVWGDSIGGGVALVVAAVDPRIAAVVAQVPAFGEEILPSDDGGEWFRMIRDIVLSGDLESYDGEVIGPLPVVSDYQDGNPSHLPTLTAYHWFMSYGARYGTHWDNKATYELLATPKPFESQPCVSHINPPILMVIAEEEDMPAANSDVARNCYERAKEPKELVEVGGGHFGLLYPESAEFKISVEVQQDFLRRHLLD